MDDLRLDEVPRPLLFIWAVLFCLVIESRPGTQVAKGDQTEEKIGEL